MRPEITNQRLCMKCTTRCQLSHGHASQSLQRDEVVSRELQALITPLLQPQELVTGEGHGL